MSMKFHSFFVLPALALGLAGPSSEQGGGALPLEPTVSLRLHLSDATPYWGQHVQVAGVVPRRARGAVVVRLSDGLGHQKPLGSVRPGANGRWRLRFVARSSGTVVAVNSGVANLASARGGSRLQVAAHLVLPAGLSLTRNSTVHLAARVAPAGRWKWEVRRLGPKRNANGLVASGVTSASSRISVSLRSRRGDRLQLVIKGAKDFAGASATTEVARLRPAVASWYGLYGDGVACGGTLGVNQIGVAHKTLPCGTKVTIRYRGRTIIAPVIDRGPFISGREFDLTGAAARALHFDGVDTIWVSP